MTNFELDISYSQISVFNNMLKEPFNDWTPQHVSQGFSWRPQSVSFKTLIDNGTTSVKIRLLSERPNPEGIRAIVVPFECPDNGAIEISSISYGKEVCIAQGQYQLMYEVGCSEGKDWCRFTFVPSVASKPEILLCDDELSKPDKYLMESKPA